LVKNRYNLVCLRDGGDGSRRPRRREGERGAAGEQIFEHIGRVLAHCGADVSRIASVLIHLTNMEDRARINPVRIRYFGAHRPASTLVQVPALVHPDLLVEVTCTAYLGP
jgi:2-iminobutanoate/2-iminopropanoate deaminase